MHQYIDIHSHSRTLTPQTLRVFSMYEQYELVPENPYCSIGIHPWHIDLQHDQLEEIRRFAAHPNVLAIGECGLDSTILMLVEDQEQYFIPQIEIANEVGKPLIIHCVKAFNEVRKALKTAKAAVPVIFHGYNRKASIAQQLLNDGCYLSFGQSLYHQKTAEIEVFRTMPADRFFLESDDATPDMEQLYARAAEIRGTNIKEIILQVNNNFEKVFKIV